jgi:hypothetical protein
MKGQKIMYENMYAEWIAEDRFALGNKLIEKHEIRKVHAKKGDKYILAGRNGEGFFGWVDEKNIKILYIS